MRQIIVDNSFKSEKTKDYEVLGVPKNATPHEIRKAFHRLALRYHPDKNNAPEAKVKFAEINEAYAQLNSSPQPNQIAMSLTQFSAAYYLIMIVALAWQERLERLTRAQQRQRFIGEIEGLWSSLTSFYLYSTASILIADLPMMTLSHYGASFGSLIHNYALTSFLNHGDHSINPNPLSTGHQISSALSNYLSGFLNSDIRRHLIFPTLSNPYFRRPSTHIPADFWSAVPVTPIPMPSNSSNHEKFELAGFTLEDLPADKEHLVCPLSGQIFSDPVNNEKLGLPNVERGFIETWIQKMGGQNPYNKQPLKIGDLISNEPLKKEAYDFVNEMISRKESNQMVKL